MKTAKAARLGAMITLFASGTAVRSFAVEIISPELALRIATVLSLDGKATDAQLDARLAAFTNAIVNSKGALTNNASGVIDQALGDPSVVNAGGSPVVLSSCSFGLNCCAVQFLDNLKPCLKFCVQCLQGVVPGGCRLTCATGFAQCVNQYLCNLGVCLNGNCPTAGPPGGQNPCFPKPVACQPRTCPGTGGLGTATYQMGQTVGSFTFTWIAGEDTGVTITSGPNILFNAGCNTNGTATVNLSGDSNVSACSVTVSMQPLECDEVGKKPPANDAKDEASGSYTISCPQ